MKYSLHMGRVAGIKIAIHWTFLILIAWIVITNVNAGLGPTDVFWSVLFVLAIFVCVTLHELGHALMAQRYDIKTRSITLLPIGGLARMESIPEDPRQELMVALAGPAVNLVIAAVLFPFVGGTGAVANLSALEKLGPGNFFLLLMIINIWLALFNLIPAFPMDGGRVFRALLSFRLNRVKATRMAASLGQMLAILFAVVGFFVNPFLIFIAIFIFLGAQAEAQFSEARALLKGYTVGDVLMHKVPEIRAEDSLGEAANKLLEGQDRNFVVFSDGRAIGTLSKKEILQALQEKGENVYVRDLKQREPFFVPSEMELDKAWSTMQQQKKPIMLVESEGELKGMLDEENLMEFIQIRTALGRAS